MAPKNHVYVSVRDYLGIDIDGLIAVPASELKQEIDNAKDGK